jgi:choline dehydrogenase-like flavoprotein
MPDVQYDADVIVIGSGVTGALTAYELAKAGKNVLILEAGDRVERWKAIEKYRSLPDKSIANNSPYPNRDWAPNPIGGKYLEQKGPVGFATTYVRMVGGTTWHWDSATWRLLPNDFKLKSVYGRGRDWPISYDDLEPYYYRAEVEMGVNGYDVEDQSGQGASHFPPRSAPYPTPGHPFSSMQRKVAEMMEAAGYHPIHEPNARASRPYDGRPACAGNNTCDPICPIGAKYTGDIHVDKALAKGARLLSNAVVYRLDADDAGRIVSVSYMTPDKTRHTLHAKQFVLAAHAIETPKILLMSTSTRYPNGLANSSGMVGRNLMDHTGLGFNIVAKDELWPGTGPNALLVFLNARDGAFRKTRASYKTKLRNTAVNTAVTQALLAKGIMGSELDRQIKFQSARQVSLAVDLETLPNPENRIVPSRDRVDAIGIPVPEIHFDVDAYWNAGRDAAVADIARYADVLQGTITMTDLGRQNREHIMGTMIMGSDPRDSVVDADCRSHDHHNLFVAGTSVMPAVGCVNPTLTGAALAIRLADRIKTVV